LNQKTGINIISTIKTLLLCANHAYSEIL